MGDIFHQKADRDLFFDAFANDLGSQLDQLRFEYDDLENGTIPEEPKVVTEDKTPSIALENKVQDELEKNLANIGGEASPTEHHHKEHSKFYTMTIQRAFSTVSLMTNFKSNFWKRRHGKHSKHHNEPLERRASTASVPETNNNLDVPVLKVNGESEGRATIYSTVPRAPKTTFGRSKTMSPSRNRPKGAAVLPDGIEQLDRTDSGNIYVPPVIVDGQVVHDYQYVTPESTPVHKPEKSDFHRRNSLSRLFRRKKSPRKSPKVEKSPKPIKALYEKTVLTASNSELNKAAPNGDAKPNGNVAHTNGHVSKSQDSHQGDSQEAPIQL